MIPLHGLNDVTYTVDSIDRAVQFYTEVLGLILIQKDDTSASLTFRRSNDIVYLETGWIDPGVHVGYHVSDVRAFIAEYEEAGYTTVRPLYGGESSTHAMAQDLDGNTIEVSDSKPFDRIT